MTVFYIPKLLFQVYDIFKCFIITSKQIYNDKTDFLRRKKISFYEEKCVYLEKNGWKIKQYIAIKDYTFFSQLKLL